MLIQKQPNRWTCMVTAVASVIDMPVKEFLTHFKHDGSTIMFPRHMNKHQGFHMQEILEALILLGWGMISFEEPFYMRLKPGSRCPLCWGSGKAKMKPCATRYKKFIAGNLGVIGIREHAYAWDGKRAYDPGNGHIIKLNSKEINQFHMLVKIHST